MKIYFGTENKSKAQEVELLFKAQAPAFKLLSIADLPETLRGKYNAEEVGATYAQNALIKAQALFRLLDKNSFDYILAEDSGFEVDALGGAPGLHSARYAANDDERCKKILAAIEGNPTALRRARFIACVALLKNGNDPVYFFGRKEGTVATALYGSDGFGYDPIFIPEGGTKTWGEAGKGIKNTDSHRSRAFSLAAQYILSVVSQ
ncbi:MAG TPA: non-canonical purine NTP pyrophosphatase [Turneriella sp.]|nr:non-canonical purine NTP pyrophosphatase [Turneriella sp.]